MTTLWPSNLTADALSSSQQPVIQQLSQVADQVWKTMPQAWQQQIQSCWLPLASHLAALATRYQEQHQKPAILGIHGGQGSGKSTLCNALAEVYKVAFNWKVAVISIDDLYLTKAQRQQLALDVHPLLTTRGVPGTHDVQAGLTLFEQLRSLNNQKLLSFPSFDKIADDRSSTDQWHSITGPVDLILFEGWCVGCKAGTVAELQQAINTLEQTEDPDGQWRHWVNQQLREAYQDWFAQIDYLLMLKVPGMGAVQQWRTQQEADNEKASKSQGGMNPAQIQRFIQHYQRLTERALNDMPGYADLVLELNEQHQVAAIRYAKDTSLQAEQ
ncbi:hypothetical protein [Bacterioplanoides sp. SCSIO 12839]|uniref:hypothetical protein n=1 Tax=Bacterioplanoides sp. SCSIO 12839 TaxID=2829569 RepID=UPI00210846CA|nr:hypothetical protein [Bacterioplanoides sp. SCSIO 12839]UTW47082.1 hypothetical protein KFF03_10830 [Bacterioplanoides sp. SCSIO 12839]